MADDADALVVAGDQEVTTASLRVEAFRLLKLGTAVTLVALAAAGFAIGFRVALEAVTGHNIVAMITAAPWWQRLLLPAVGGLLAGGIAMLILKRSTSSMGVGNVMEAIVLGRTRVPLLRSLMNALASWLAIATGNSLGREGPLIMIGAAAAEAARRLFRIDEPQSRLVLAAGVAAGFASAYNAPIAAVLFVVEIVTGVLVLEAIVPILCASVIATLTLRLAIGAAPLYGERTWSIEGPELLICGLIGLLAAPLGVGFLHLLALAEKLWRPIPLPLRPALGGLVCGVILIFVPSVAGNGFEPISQLLDGNLTIPIIAYLLIAKPLATYASVGSGQPGGVFTPTLLIGGLAASFLGGGPYALVGMAAALAATTHAPITCAILACELTNDYALALPLLLACALAAGLARRLYIDSVYTAELSKRGLRWRLTLDGRRVVENQQQIVDVV